MKRFWLLILSGFVFGAVIPFFRGNAIWWFPIIMTLFFIFMEVIAPAKSVSFWQRVEIFGERIGYYNGVFISSIFFIMIFMPMALFFRAFRLQNDDVSLQKSFYQEPELYKKENFERIF